MMGPARAAGKVVHDKRKKILVAYYSATGSTKRVARYIIDAIGADEFELVPEVPYTHDDLALRHTDVTCRVRREHDDERLRDVALCAAKVENWEVYDVVFIGYPIWWYIAAWPVNGFVKANDFSGRTVIPFCTHGGSGLGRSADLLAETAGSGNWLNGRGFGPRTDGGAVREWLRELGL